jgi:hypothetical protein
MVGTQDRKESNTDRFHPSVTSSRCNLEVDCQPIRNAPELRGKSPVAEKLDMVRCCSRIVAAAGCSEQYVR